MLRPIGEPAHNGCSEMLSEPVVRSERAGAAARIQGLCHLISYNAPFVAIGRALQPFPRSKPGRPVFWHPAFQLDRSTRQGRIDRCRSNGAPEGLMVASRHLHSALHPFTCLWIDLPWRTFTLSCPLQPRIRLLRRLRPPSRVLAFSFLHLIHLIWAKSRY